MIPLTRFTACLLSMMVGCCPYQVIRSVVEGIHRTTASVTCYTMSFYRLWYLQGYYWVFPY
ncbi:hypothetical protein BP00DRAFT_6559 [Aspergillus indologenus CBS 114.80]|uniref:Uncharacterized protein n=1 Tax=Aspergillus indologenus CBS 114.80 TaxID=1450541 RepID=A0A2V5IJW3_9EURO|nr:hypothetical protein BP00DRAFT_6559 [Aspergillus indologenus CBS 114.80]